MTTPTFEGHLGTQVAFDLCPTCQVIWFDDLENLRLAPAAVLKLFRLIGERSQTSPAPITGRLKCPRCDAPLSLTHDRQRNTPFRYWRCASEHGRLITFFDFLREKDFIRPLSPEQLADLRRNVQTINCSNCGAPIDLAAGLECAHCSAPISMLDLKQIDRMADQLAQAEKPQALDPLLPARLARDKQEVDALFDSMRADGGWNTSSSFGLVEWGLRLLARRLS